MNVEVVAASVPWLFGDQDFRKLSISSPEASYCGPFIGGGNVERPQKGSRIRSRIGSPIGLDQEQVQQSPAGLFRAHHPEKAEPVLLGDPHLASIFEIHHIRSMYTFSATLSVHGLDEHILDLGVKDPGSLGIIMNFFLNENKTK